MSAPTRALSSLVRYTEVFIAITFGSSTAACAKTSKLPRNDSYGWWTATSRTPDLTEDAWRLSLRDGEAGRQDRHPGLVLEVGSFDPRELHQVGEVERALDAVDLALLDAEPEREPFHHLVGCRCAHLDAHDVAEAALAQLALYGLEEVGRVVGHLEVGVARDAEGRALEDRGTREERRQEVRDDLLHRDEEAAIPDLDEARKALGDLHPGEALLAGIRIRREDGKGEREAGDVRERLSGADGEGREHRVDLALEVLLEPLQLLLLHVLDAADDDALVSERRPELLLPDPRLLSRSGRGPARECARAPVAA